MSHEAKPEERSRIINALVGGWVADAASLGLHWLYDSQRIHEVGGLSPEFMAPTTCNYQRSQNCHHWLRAMAVKAI
ncbi:hypothetical protein SAMN05216369_3243 [Marinobacter antarcticus]|uniref:ADP-ribosylglycohydrolase n=1 Tax=Marinobacter antarcticus TaxID=564117 RepID=A0A1M6VJZ9_9GAMM|nr:hypothetical protein [Marinobacter antarcticus]SHK81788.1 hypothetical protein SAMN05216369_3243 [Marinobacter antarcticus]